MFVYYCSLILFSNHQVSFMDFQIIYFISSLFVLQFFTMALSSYYCRYQSLSQSRFTKISAAISYPTSPISWFINFKLKIIKKTKARYHVREACSGKDSISFRVASKTVFQRIGPLLEFVNFIVDLGIA